MALGRICLWSGIVTLVVSVLFFLTPKLSKEAYRQVQMQFAKASVRNHREKKAVPMLPASSSARGKR